MSESDPIVRLSRIRKTYRQGDVDIHAVDGVDFEARSGEFSAFAGPSGSGKTTLLNIIGGLDGPDEGEVEVEGRRYGEMSDAERADLRLHRIGFVFQAYNLIPVLTAVENVEYVLRLQGVGKAERRDRARAMLAEVGLEDKENRRPSELSGGQQQRVAVARAIVSEPALVLADEPTANLDSATGDLLLELMGQMNERRGVTFLFSTHDKGVMDSARRILSVRDGRIVEDRVKAGGNP